MNAATVALTPAQLDAIEQRAEVDPELAAAVHGRRIEATEHVVRWLGHASNCEDEWATYWQRRGEPELARFARGASQALANAMWKVGRAVPK